MPGVRLSAPSPSSPLPSPLPSRSLTPFPVPTAPLPSPPYALQPLPPLAPRLLLSSARRSASEDELQLLSLELKPLSPPVAAPAGSLVVPCGGGGEGGAFVVLRADMSCVVYEAARAAPGPPDRPGPSGPAPPFVLSPSEPVQLSPLHPHLTFPLGGASCLSPSLLAVSCPSSLLLVCLDPPSLLHAIPLPSTRCPVLTPSDPPTLSFLSSSL
ncbi:hypothetical protein TeGR_g12994, partial [Tetraparma gracilis]